MRAHSVSERSVGYVFLMHDRVRNYHYPTLTFRTVSSRHPPARIFMRPAGNPRTPTLRGAPGTPPLYGEDARVGSSFPHLRLCHLATRGGWIFTRRGLLVLADATNLRGAPQPLAPLPCPVLVI